MIPAPLLVGVELNPGPTQSKEKRKDIITLKNIGLPHQQIAKQLDIGLKTENGLEDAKKL